MPSHFKTLGPFELAKTSEPIETKDLKAYWELCNEKEGNLSNAIGIYIMTIGTGKDMKAVYVGKAEHGFRARLKPSHDAFRKLRTKYPNEMLSVLFLARVSPAKEKFVRKRESDESLKSIKDLEILLIRDCLSKGIELVNTSEKKAFQELRVPGYLHDGGMKQSGGAKRLHKLIRAKKAIKSKTNESKSLSE